MIRPTGRALALGVLAFLSTAVLALFAPGIGILCLAPFALLLLFLLIDVSALPRARHLQVRLELPPYVETGESARGSLTMRMSRKVPHILEPDIRGSGGSVDLVLGLREDAGGQTSWPLQIFGSARGETVFEHLRLGCLSQLGLMRRHLRFELDQAVRANVSTRGAKQAALTLEKRGVEFGVRAQIAKGQGSEFEAMRDYQAGMDPRLIDWKQTAKRGGLIAKEMRLEQNHQVYLVFDTGYLMSTQVDGLSKLDHAINAALAIGWAASQQGDQIGTFSFDARPRSFSPPKRGKSGYAALKYELGALQPAAVETNPTFGITRLRQRLNRRALIVIFTDFVDTTTAELMVEHLGLMARDHLVAFVAVKNPDVEAAIWQDPEVPFDLSSAVMASEIQSDRQLVLAKLRSAGIFCLDVAPENLTTNLLNTYLSIRERQLQ